MDLSALVVFGAVVFLGSYVQAVTGFAMGMLIVAVAGGLRLLSIPDLAATTSLLTIINVVLAVWGQTRHVYRPIFIWLALGQIPAILVGFLIMDWMDGRFTWLLEMLLGGFILAGAISMWIKPHPWTRVASPSQSFATGVAGGILGGMFSASGPILGWFFYNQPLALASIRATLLSCFVLTTTARTVIVGVDGGLTSIVMSYAAIGLPLVILGTWLGRSLPPPLSEAQIKRMANLILLLMGAWIIVRSVLAVLD